MAGDFAALAALVMITILILAFLRLLETVVVGQLIKAALQHHQLLKLIYTIVRTIYFLAPVS